MRGSVLEAGPRRRYTPRRMHAFIVRSPALRRGLSAAVAALLACACAGSSGPTSTLDKYGAALERGEYEAAYALMSERFREEHSAEDFARMMREGEGEVDETVRRLRSGHGSVEISAEVRFDLGDTLRLVKEDGQWRIAANPIQFYGQSTPREALRSFLRAYRLERWEVMLRLVPDPYRERMTAEMVEQQFRGSRAEEIAAMMDLLEANLDAPISERGDEARMPFAEQYETRFTREGGSWKIEEPY
jgi:hypothetical protein